MNRQVLIGMLVSAAVLVACRAAAPDATPAAEEQTSPESLEIPSLAGTTWQWVEYESADGQVNIEGSQYYLITFKADGSLKIKADCNRALGSYTVESSV